MNYPFFNNLPGENTTCISEHVNVECFCDNKKIGTQYVPGRPVLETIGVKVSIRIASRSLQKSLNGI